MLVEQSGTPPTQPRHIFVKRLSSRGGGGGGLGEGGGGGGGGGVSCCASKLKVGISRHTSVDGLPTAPAYRYPLIVAAPTHCGC